MTGPVTTATTTTITSTPTKTILTTTTTRRTDRGKCQRGRRLSLGPGSAVRQMS